MQKQQAETGDMETTSSAHPFRLVVPGKDALLLVIGGVMYSEPVLAVVGGARLVVGPCLHKKIASRLAMHMSYTAFVLQHLQVQSMDIACSIPGQSFSFQCRGHSLTECKGMASWSGRRKLRPGVKQQHQISL